MARAAVFTISDSRSAGIAADESGPVAVELLAQMGIETVHRAIVPDERTAIAQTLHAWINRVELIVTAGGTGIAPRDVTPEAVAAIIEKPLPGFGEAMRLRVFDAMPLSIVSRGGAGIAGGTLIVYLPGSPSAVRDGLQVIGPALRHVVKKLSRPGDDCAPDRAAAARRTGQAAEPNSS
ncbi:MAG: MogA/MoaB family molybdenum cofactor biosynthesis protein [Phycisphaerae bacterium]|nr:MogA/MoaB family molybdenum cofactor biosynthesis protein [Phycisphaerae bacterium]NUQ45269.1 MogA/MoaB family molybdenum cofactor biosynthesis protein [Phycisphaerae bacterium]